MGMKLVSQEQKIQIGEEEVIFSYFSPQSELPVLQHPLATPLVVNQLLCDLENTNLDLFVGHHITAMVRAFYMTSFIKRFTVRAHKVLHTTSSCS